MLPNTWDPEARGLPKIRSQPGLRLPKPKKKKKGEVEKDEEEEEKKLVVFLQGNINTEAKEQLVAPRCSWSPAGLESLLKLLFTHLTQHGLTFSSLSALLCWP